MLILQDNCIEAEMFNVRAQLWYNAVRLFAMSAANIENEKEILVAP